jgi:catechol 2,3-dioxygenase-like lactoylglutathione lyase family enzyme
MHIHELNLI